MKKFYITIKSSKLGINFITKIQENKEYSGFTTISAELNEINRVLMKEKGFYQFYDKHDEIYLIPTKILKECIIRIVEFKDVEFEDDPVDT